MSKRKLLLADDSITIQKVVNLTFADEGVEVISVSDGNSAMDKLREDSPDLVLVDINMPGLNGYEICEKIKQSANGKTTPVILLVGSFEPFDENEARRVGADDYLTKPFQSISQLVEKVNSLLDLNDDDDDSDDTFEMPFSTSQNLNDDSENLKQTSYNSEHLGESDGFDDEIIQTNQIGSVPVDDVVKFKSDSPIPRIFVDDEIFEQPSTQYEIVEQKTVYDFDTSFAEEPKLDFDEIHSETTSGESWNEPDSDEEDEPTDLNNDSSESENIFEKILFDQTDSVQDVNFENNVSSEVSMSDEFADIDLDELNLLELPPLILETAEETQEKMQVVEQPENSPIANQFDFEDFQNVKNSPAELDSTEINQANTDDIERQIKDLVSPEIVEMITKKVVERLSEIAVREVAWEVVPQMADLIIKELAKEKMKN